MTDTGEPSGQRGNIGLKLGCSMQLPRLEDESLWDVVVFLLFVFFQFLNIEIRSHCMI